MTEIPQKSSKRRRYPSLSLEQAVERARVLYERERTNPVPIEIITEHWGFKNSKTGPASTAYSAVKQFGLIEEIGARGERKAAISQRGRAILTAPDHVREGELRIAALEPPMNRLIWDRYGPDPGSDSAFRWTLVSELGFSDTGAGEFSKQYRATVLFAGLDDAALIENSPPVASNSVPDEADDESGSEPQPESSFRPRSSQPGASPVPTAVAAYPTSAHMSRHAIPLIGGKQVILEGEFPLTEEAWTGFMAVLAAFKPGLVEAVQPVAATPAAQAEDAAEESDE